MIGLKVQFITLGCKVNQYETEAIRELLTSAGFEEVKRGEKADVCVINTCTVTKHADTDSLSYIRKSQRLNPEALIVVTGCLAEKDKETIDAIPFKKVILSNQDKGKILNVINEHIKSTFLKLPAYNPKEELSISDFHGRSKAFIKIQDGCNNFCSYCKVPYVRGRSRSRQLGNVADEFKRLIDKGFKEVIFTGICLGEWGKDLRIQSDISELLSNIIKIEGDYRIRLSSIEPNNVTDGLIEAIKSSEKICNHLHIPLQSGDDLILKKMNRKYTSNDYIEIIDKIRQAKPDIAITTDCIVGFPGESDANFKNSLKVIDAIKPLKVHIFPYSNRKLTLASNFKDTVESKVIKERIMVFKNIADKLSFDYRLKFFGKTLEVLIETRNKSFQSNELKEFIGYSDNYISTFILSNTDLKIGSIVKAEMRGIYGDLSLGLVSS